MRSSLGNTNTGHVKGVAAGEGLIIYICKGFVPQKCGRIRRVTAGEGGGI